ncbi:hypothetical protein LB518_13070 [Mesorhizobium sp. BR1-1-16]|uniref:hypothetical protein n=1 Tax=Mesorhizobium sp. BR1-1-16 TaxID=2876653 RepID=UPI001CCED924|nr:hypothetical protein [Mesorhizobium sp. BR1-1-16]MBZ9937229.1 hypothetical protein [Mesorhizobium sp. BR1-1-16]
MKPNVLYSAAIQRRLGVGGGPGSAHETPRPARRDHRKKRHQRPNLKTEQDTTVTERFERHRQAWTAEELQKLKLLAGKGMALKAISKAMTRSEESIKDRAKLDGIGIAKLR